MKLRIFIKAHRSDEPQSWNEINIKPSYYAQIYLIADWYSDNGYVAVVAEEEPI